MESTFWLQSDDSLSLYVKKWYRTTAPKAIIQLTHGMTEYIDRYDEIATFFVDNGFTVYGHDHRGHGQTGLNQGQLGFFAEHNGFKKVIEDLHIVTNKIKSEHPNTPIILLGHSMGSFVSRCYIQKYSRDVDGLVLSGTGVQPGFMTTFGKNLSRLLPQNKPARLMDMLAFGANNRKIKDTRTEFDWLTRDESIVNQYIADDLCGFIPTARFYVDLMKGIEQTQKKRLNKKIHADLPILFVSGDMDPVGGYGKGVLTAAKMYDAAGVRDITVTLFPHGRHEIINEINRTEVYEFILAWTKKHVLN